MSMTNFGRIKQQCRCCKHCIIIEYARDYCKFICSADNNTYETPDVNFESKPVCSCCNHKFEYSDKESNLIIDHHKFSEIFIEQFRNNFNPEHNDRN